MDIPAISKTDFAFPGQTGVYHGKVRDIYYLDDKLLSIATDRVSAFDQVLPRPVPYKGQVLNQLAAHFLEKTAGIVPNWLQAVPDANASIGVKAEPFKVEVVVRSMLVGHAWREYKAGKREISGQPLPGGLKEYDYFPGPIITPTSKAEKGHDQDISETEILENGLATDNEWQQIKDYALKLFEHGQDMARSRGLILADTKYEFGRLSNGRIVLIDEVHTPDSSRYFYIKGYETYADGSSTEAPRHLSKEFLRQWLMDRGFDGTGQPPEMDDGFVQEVSDRYIELYEQMTGQTFVKADSGDPLRRIETNVLHYIKGNLA
ncbi:MAG TPA: phosphoribosylaminoimidazolesuccinocarboxamide synthase [Candidatus Saccharimonadales bacterium]|nr:phosphoribosylaminoimidazolesuccinocarboxamide synthase [Candidatus Saccharimonadales bacterium]